MYTTEDLLKRLSKGEDPEAIAKEFSDALNKAQSKYKETKSKEENKLKLAKSINDNLSEYFKLYLPNYKYDVTPEAIIELLDSLKDTRTLFSDINRFWSLFD